jgi:hypothetical protein
MFFDPLYLLFLIPSMLLALWAQSRVKGAFEKYSRVATQRGVTGLDAARVIMQRYGLGHVKVNQIAGEMTDHYDPRNKSMALSQSSVYNSVASGAIVPAVQVGGWVGPLIITAGAVLGSLNLIWIGILAFALTAGFALITLPVEFDASRRAMRFLDETGLLNDTELSGAKKVLDAAALTYVAAATQAILQLLYFVIRYTGLGRRSDD